jgi:aryl-alcohol dehydrogenase (NADP+)
VRYIGVSNVLAYRFAKARGRAQLRNPMRFVPVQPHDSLLFRENKRELLPLAAED